MRGTRLALFAWLLALPWLAGCTGLPLSATDLARDGTAPDPRLIGLWYALPASGDGAFIAQIAAADPGALRFSLSLLGHERGETVEGPIYLGLARPSSAAGDIFYGIEVLAAGELDFSAAADAAGLERLPAAAHDGYIVVRVVLTDDDEVFIGFMSDKLLRQMAKDGALAPAALREAEDCQCMRLALSSAELAAFVRDGAGRGLFEPALGPFRRAGRPPAPIDLDAWTEAWAGR